MKPRALLTALILSLAPLALPAPDALAGKKPAAEAPAEPEADEIADRVQAFYNKTRTFKSAFKQRYKVKAYNKTKDSGGVVIFEKPGKMSWRYTNGNRVVADGKLIKIYERDNKQMYEQQMAKSQYPAALSFLVGEGDLKKTFKLKKLDAKAFKYENGYVLEAIPNEPTPAYEKMILWIDPRTSHVRKVMLIDAQGNRNTFVFEKPSVNKPAPKGEFVFKTPAGTQVIKP